MTDTFTATPSLGRKSSMTLTTPTGLQSVADLSFRRRLVMGLNSVTWLAMMAVAARVLGHGGWSLIDVVMFVCFAIGTPWAVLGFWNALIGLWLLHFHRDSMAEVAPFAAAGDEADVPQKLG